MLSPNQANRKRSSSRKFFFIFWKKEDRRGRILRNQRLINFNLTILKGDVKKKYINEKLHRGKLENWKSAHFYLREIDKEIQLSLVLERKCPVNTINPFHCSAKRGQLLKSVMLSMLSTRVFSFCVTILSMCYLYSRV